VADETEKQPGSVPPFIGVEPGYPPVQMPTVFADGAANFATIAGTVRFYLLRHDPENKGSGTFKSQPFAQVIIPTAEFAQMTAFFEKALKHFVASGTISRDVVNAARVAEGVEPWPPADTLG
jgi:hypothetical protein